MAQANPKDCRTGGRQLTAKNTTATPDASQSTSKGISSISGHGRLRDLERLAERRDLEHIEASPEQQIAELDGLLLRHSRLGGRDSEGHRCCRLWMTGP